MTTAAREVLEDCRGAVAELIDGVQGRQWRRRWVVAVVLLRAVGHVLDKVDADRSPAYRAAISAWWVGIKGTKPKPEIFWGFIEDERNTILKEYRTSAGQGATVQLGGIEFSLGTYEVRADQPGPTIHHYTVDSGPFAGREQRDLLSEAIAWWERELDGIDKTARDAL
jgi:hypothetical protein